MLSRVVYGDTDSVMPRLACVKPLTPEDHEMIGEQICMEITEYLCNLFRDKGYPSPILILEAEKIFLGFLSLSKKRYIGYKKEPGGEPKLSITGAQGVRRDNFLAMTHLYTGILDAFIVQKKPSAAVFLLKDTLDGLKNATTPLEDLLFTTQVRRTYKSENVVGFQLKESALRKGVEVPSGTRISYFISDSKNPSNSGVAKKAEYYNGEKTADVDYYYYMCFLRKPILELFEHFEGYVKMEPLRRLFAKTAQQQSAIQTGQRSVTAFFKPIKK